MKSITQTFRKTTGTCICGGMIVEIFSERKPVFRDTDTYGPESTIPTQIASDGYGCNACGLQYGAPVFQNTEPNEDIVFALSLIEAATIRIITLSDLALLIFESNDNGRDIVCVSTRSLELHSDEETALPAELSSLAPGTTVYIRNDEHVPSGYLKIQLDLSMNAKTYAIAKGCLK